MIADRDPRQVIKDADLAAQIGDQSLNEALGDEALARLIAERTTPDLPELNVTQEAMLVGQLAVTIFNHLLENE